MDDARGVEFLWENPINHPQCPHGPTLLLGRYVKDEVKKFYACSACRDRKLCRFYLEYGQELSKSQKRTWDLENKRFARRYVHRELYIRFNKLETEPKRHYCHNCEKLIFDSEKDKHVDHEVTVNLTDYQLHHPTELLKPLENAKKEAQYLFSKKSTEDIIRMLLKLGAKQILCIGTPRIHEYIIEHHADKMSSLLLDFDGRFHNFFGPLDYCWYNLFNHHFFNKDAIDVFKDFLTQNGGKDTYLICDPPFGGRLEPISYTIKTISDLHRKLNEHVHDDNFFLRIMFISPYFMEHIMREKSNPPHVTGGLRDLKMSDYKVDYDNHPLFMSEKHGRRQGSQVRIFTNIPLNLLELPSSGYKFCRDCEKWVSSENKHCKKCRECTSKDGQTYKHCDTCKRCVKPTWQHCRICKRCMLKKHTCGSKPNIVGRCFNCDKLGHTKNECPNLPAIEITIEPNIKERKTDCELKTSSIKKSKVGHSKEVVKQKVVFDEKEVLKLREEYLKLRKEQDLKKIKNHIEPNIKKRKTDCELKTSSIKKNKVGHSKKVVKQKVVFDEKEVLKLREEYLKLRKEQDLKKIKNRIEPNIKKRKRDCELKTSSIKKSKVGHSEKQKAVVFDEKEVLKLREEYLKLKKEQEFKKIKNCNEPDTKKRKTDCELKTSSIKKGKVGRSKEVAKQKAVMIDDKEVSKLREKNKKLKQTK